MLCINPLQTHGGGGGVSIDIVIGGRSLVGGRTVLLCTSLGWAQGQAPVFRFLEAVKVVLFS
jgi:hypothetical protein